VKQPKPKPHLYVAQTKAREGGDLRAICMKEGEAVKKAKFVWDDTDVRTEGGLLRAIAGMCSKCRAAVEAGKAGDGIWYGIIDGQEGRDSELL
jgi:hypothetical protein